MEPLDRFLAELRPPVREHRVEAACRAGSRARGTADERSDIDVIIVAVGDRPDVERFKDYLPVVVASPAGVDMWVYTPEEFERLKNEERPFLMHALDGAKLIHEG